MKKTKLKPAEVIVTKTFVYAHMYCFTVPYYLDDYPEEFVALITPISSKKPKNNKTP